MIDCINATRSGHIVTIEDPIEFLHRDKHAFVTQREVDVDKRATAINSKVFSSSQSLRSSGSIARPSHNSTNKPNNTATTLACVILYIRHPATN
jgi:hypothetical protein